MSEYLQFFVFWTHTVLMGFLFCFLTAVMSAASRYTLPQPVVRKQQ